MKQNNWLHKLIPSKEKLLAKPYIKWLSPWLNQPGYWEFKRKPVVLGSVLGVFFAWVPLPMHSLPALFIALYLKANLPIIFAFMLLANPLIMPMFYYFGYKLGVFLLNYPVLKFKALFDSSNFFLNFHLIWKPLGLGCIVLGCISSLVIGLMLYFLWPNNDDDEVVS